MALAVATLSAIAAAQQGAVPPRIKAEAEAVYPEAARGLEREVLLVVTIDAEGRVTDAQLAEPTGDALDDVALDMVRRY
ncbi:MAG TPA: TonB family protein, partial [Polyangiaceae bacterium]|nr:TonB family protein [Polyangiaceae bacterium]